MNLLFLGLAVAACKGRILGDVKPPGGPDAGIQATVLDGVTHFTCDPTQKPAMDQLRALTTQQYVNTLSDLVSKALGSPDAGPALLGSLSVAAALAQLPANTPTIPLPLVDATPASASNSTTLAGEFPEGGWLRADQSIQASRVQAFYGVGLAVAQELTSPQLLGQAVGTCAVGADAGADTACLDAFIQGFGSRALRRAVTAQDVTFYTGLYNLNGPDTTAKNPAAAAYQDVITGMLNAPEFLYFVEHGDTAVANLAGVYQLGAFELASRLSYHFWDTLPDDELWARAQDGTLLTPAVYQGQVDRLFADPRAQATLNRFLVDYFQTESQGGPHGTGGLNYHDLAAPNTLAAPIFQAFAGADLPTPTLYPDMVDDALGMVDYLTWTAPGTMHELLTSTGSYSKASDVARLYGVSPWDGASAPPQLPADRPGLFTHALFTSAGLDTSPILKGIFLRRFVLCDTLGPPPAAAANASVPVTTTETTRQATTALTANSPCSACHTEWINPLGFATENFDGLGRSRTQQTLYNPDGTVATKLAVDTSVTPFVMMADATTTANGPVDLMNLIEATNKPAACLSRNYFRYAFARFEDLSLDGCSLELIRQTLDNGGHLQDLWKAVAQTPAFKQRSF